MSKIQQRQTNILRYNIAGLADDVIEQGEPQAGFCRGGRRSVTLDWRAGRDLLVVVRVKVRRTEPETINQNYDYKLGQFRISFCHAVRLL